MSYFAVACFLAIRRSYTFRRSYTLFFKRKKNGIFLPKDNVYLKNLYVRLAVSVFIEKTHSQHRLCLSQVMYSFLERIINLGIPRTGDFQGVNPNSFDGNGNLRIALTGTGMGMIEQGVFPEIVYDDAVGKARQLDVCITTTAETDKEGHRLLALMGMPFREGSGSRP